MKITRENCHKMKGTEFKFIDSEGIELNAFIPQIDDNVGCTIKDINNDEPERFLLCFPILSFYDRGYTSKEKQEEFIETFWKDKSKSFRFLGLLNIIEQEGKVDLRNIDSQISTQKSRNGFGSCPF